MIAAELAALRPEIVGKLVLLAPFGIADVEQLGFDLYAVRSPSACRTCSRRVCPSSSRTASPTAARRRHPSRCISPRSHRRACSGRSATAAPSTACTASAARSSCCGAARTSCCHPGLAEAVGRRHRDRRRRTPPRVGRARYGRRRDQPIHRELNHGPGGPQHHVVDRRCAVPLLPLLPVHRPAGRRGRAGIAVGRRAEHALRPGGREPALQPVPAGDGARRQPRLRRPGRQRAPQHAVLDEPGAEHHGRRADPRRRRVASTCSAPRRTSSTRTVSPRSTRCST